MSERPYPGPPDDPQGAAEVSRRISAILDAVEREAARLREEAREEAERYMELARRRADGLVEERRHRIAALSDELIAKSEAVVGRLDDAAPVRQGFENLVRALGEAAERLSRETHGAVGEFRAPPFHAAFGEPGPAAAPQPEPAAPHAPPPAAAPPPAHQPDAPRRWAATPPAPEHQPPPPPASRELEDARMVAIQMAAAGVTRGSIRAHLIRGLGIADVEPLLDELFGPGTGDSATVPWDVAPR